MAGRRPLKPEAEVRPLGPQLDNHNYDREVSMSMDFEGFRGNEERHGLPIFHIKHNPIPAPAAPDYEEDANGNTFLAPPTPPTPNPVTANITPPARGGVAGNVVPPARGSTPRFVGPPTPAPRR